MKPGQLIYPQRSDLISLFVQISTAVHHNVSSTIVRNFRTYNETMESDAITANFEHLALLESLLKEDKS